MKDFVFNTPTKVYFGKNTQYKLGEIISELGYKKIMIQYGKSSVVKSGLLGVVKKQLDGIGVTYVEVGGVEPNPKLTFVRNAVKLAKDEKVEFILAVGGGSVIDSSKFTAIGAKTDVDVWEFPIENAVVKDALPVGCILTLSAAGSEMSSSAVLTNLEENKKKGLTSEFNRCKFAIMNPELTYSVNPYQTSCGVVDIMAHTMERYFTVVEDTPLTDAISEAILKSVIEAGTILMKNPEDYNARATVMWASSLSHNGLTGAGRENYLAVHQLEHALSGEFDAVAHGAGLAVLFPAWAKYVYKANVKRFCQFARNVWGVNDGDDQTCALKGIEKMGEYFKSLNMPTTLKDFGVGVESLDKLADLTTNGKSRQIKSYIPLGYEEVKDIFTSCL